MKPFSPCFPFPPVFPISPIPFPPFFTVLNKTGYTRMFGRVGEQKRVDRGPACLLKAGRSPFVYGSTVLLTFWLHALFGYFANKAVLLDAICL